MGGMVWAQHAFRKSIKNNLPVSSQEPHGVGDVLAFFIFMSTYIAPFLSVGLTISNLIDLENENPHVLSMSGWVWYKYFLIGAAIIWSFWQWRVARKLRYQFAPASVNAVKLLLVGSALFPFVDYFLLSLSMNVGDAAESMRKTNKALFLSFLWFAYFCFSKRVKNTYYTPVAEEKSETAV